MREISEISSPTFFSVLNKIAPLSGTLGLYIHIPFCKSKCSYCDFYSIIHRKGLLDIFIECLIMEIDLVAENPKYYLPVRSIYFGGGTPSILKPEDIARILQVLRTKFALIEDAEITIEANPESVDNRKLLGLIDAGVNRISIGVQSFQDEELRSLGRIHDGEEARTAIIAAANAGFRNISADLMFAVPNQNIDALIENINIASQLAVNHISLYGLTIEKATPLYEELINGRIGLPDEDSYAEAYSKSVAMLANLGFSRYEVSNFAFPGFECRHNLNYWNYGSYLGFDPSAHSALIKENHGELQVQRFWNMQDFDEYIMRIKAGNPATAATEILSQEKVNLERLQLSLRLAEGYPLAEAAKFQKLADSNRLRNLIHDLECEALVRINENGNLIVTDKGMPIIDEIIASLSALIS